MLCIYKVNYFSFKIDISFRKETQKNIKGIEVEYKDQVRDCNFNNLQRKFCK